MPRNPTGPVRQKKGPPGPLPDPGVIARAVSRGTTPGIDSGGLLSALIEEWGGTRRFARAIYAEFQDGKKGGMTRQKILEMISRLVIVVTNQSIARPRGAAELDDEELGLAIKDLLGRVEVDDDGPLAAAAAEEAAE